MCSSVANCLRILSVRERVCVCVCVYVCVDYQCLVFISRAPESSVWLFHNRGSCFNHMPPVCVCVCACTCVCVWVHTCVCLSMPLRVYVWICVCPLATCVYLCTCFLVFQKVSSQVCVWVQPGCVRACVRVCVHVHVCVCVVQGTYNWISRHAFISVMETSASWKKVGLRPGSECVWDKGWQADRKTDW